MHPVIILIGQNNVIIDLLDKILLMSLLIVGYGVYKILRDSRRFRIVLQNFIRLWKHDRHIDMRWSW